MTHMTEADDTAQTPATDETPDPLAGPDAPGVRQAMLKKDLFGEICLMRETATGRRWIRRDTRVAPWILRPLARHLAKKEWRALRHLPDQPDIPSPVIWRRGLLWRGYMDGHPMVQQRPTDPAYFKAALKLLTQLHRANVTHNDLAKEPNWLVKPDGMPALIDFQLARHHRRRGWLFKLMAREDLRHMLKHKKRMQRDRLTEREKAILATPSLPARLWRRTVKPVYRFVTRRLLNWADKEGTYRSDRQ